MLFLSKLLLVHPRKPSTVTNVAVYVHISANKSYPPFLNSRDRNSAAQLGVLGDDLDGGRAQKLKDGKRKTGSVGVFDGFRIDGDEFQCKCRDAVA